VYHLFEHENIIKYRLDERHVDWLNAYGTPEGAYDDPRVYSPKRYMRFGLSVKW